MELFVEQGYDTTTVTDIAARAGVTARTFFRHFADKREVLFSGSSALTEALVRAVAAAPASATAWEVVGAALDAMAEVLGGRHAFAGQRARLIDAHPELLERELVKLAALAATLRGELGARGVSPVDAALAAELGLAVFRVGFDRWVQGPGSRSLAEVMQESYAEAGAVATRLTPG
jgi:AcrR family transcriptional regulator